MFVIVVWENSWPVDALHPSPNLIQRHHLACRRIWSVTAKTTSPQRAQSRSMAMLTSCRLCKPQTRQFKDLHKGKTWKISSLQTIYHLCGLHVEKKNSTSRTSSNCVYVGPDVSSSIAYCLIWNAVDSSETVHFSPSLGK